MHVGNVSAQRSAISYATLVHAGTPQARPAQLSFSASWPVMEPNARRGRRRPRRAVCPVQIKLPLRTPCITITPLMTKIEAILIRIAQTGGEMPNNPTLGERAGGRGRSSVDRALQRLAAARRIRLETMPGRRRVHILGRELATAWGESRPGHKPFCKNARGTVAPPATAKERTPDSPALPASAHTLPVLASLAGMEWIAPAVSLAAPATCRWPMWADHEKPNGRYCDKATTGTDCSWCTDHRAVVSRPRLRATAQQMANLALGRVTGMLPKTKLDGALFRDEWMPRSD